MLIYLIVFFVSYKLLCVSQENQNVRSQKALVVMALLLPAILAGLRDYSIGTDVQVYGNSWFYYARWNKATTYFRMATSSDIGIVYAFVNYFTSLFTGSPHWFYFVLNMLTVSLIYKAAKDNADLGDVPFAMLTYYFLFYNQTLNMLRQSLAIAFVACAFTFIRKQKMWPFMVYAMLAVLSHMTAVVVFVMYMIYKVVNGKFGNLAKIGILSGAAAVIVGFFPLMKILLQRGILPMRYMTYINNVSRGGGYVRLFLLCMPYLLLLLFFVKKDSYKKERNVLICYLIISTLISSLAFRMIYTVRIGYYFDVCLIFIIPFIAGNFRINVKVGGRAINKALLTTLMLGYWVFVYGIRQSGQTVPYLFMR